MDLDRFDIRRIKDASTVLLIGAQGPNRSTFVRDVMWHHYDVMEWTRLGRTDGRFIKPLVSSRLQSTAVAKHPLEDPRALLVLEDCCEPADFDDHDMRSLYIDHRATCTTVMVVIPRPPLRPFRYLCDHTDYLCIFPELCKKMREVVWDDFALERILDTFDTFSDTLDRNACLVVDNTARTARLLRWNPAETL